MKETAMKGKRRCTGKREGCGFDFPAGVLLFFEFLSSQHSLEFKQGVKKKWTDFQSWTLIFLHKNACVLLHINRTSAKFPSMIFHSLVSYCVCTAVEKGTRLCQYWPSCFMRDPTTARCVDPSLLFTSA